MKKMVQFIAGAKCPKCGAQDTIAINADNDLIYCVSVRCDFSEERPKSAAEENELINVINMQDYKASKS